MNEKYDDKLYLYPGEPMTFSGNINNAFLNSSSIGKNSSINDSCPNITPTASMGYTRSYIGMVNPDKEAWVLDAVKRVIVAGNKLNQEKFDGRVFDYALDGIINGTVLEILEILNLKPAYVNLKK